MNPKPRGHQFVEPAFWVNAIISIAAILISIKACDEAAKIRRIEEVRMTKEYSEEISVAGYVRMIADRPFTYSVRSIASDTAMSFVPSIADFAITNNSRQPITIQEINYAQYGCIHDSLRLPCVTDRNGPTKRKHRPPIDLMAGQTIRLEDTLHICVPGMHKPYARRGGDSLYWMRWPLGADLMTMVDGARVYAPILFGKICYELSESYVGCYLRTARGNEFAFRYFLLNDSLGTMNSRALPGGPN